MPGASWTDAGTQKSQTGVGQSPPRQVDKTGSRKVNRARRNRAGVYMALVMEARPCAEHKRRYNPGKLDGLCFRDPSSTFKFLLRSEDQRFAGLDS